VSSSLTWAPANVSALNAPIGGAGAEAVSPRGPRARRNLTRGGRLPLERGGISPEGVFSSQAGRNLTRGGRPALERGGSSPV
jgi:hypothetical protein